jgi:WXG100 family type VII secretion target
MAQQIRITPGQMQTRAGEYLQVKDNELRALIQRMNTLLTNLQAEWEGQAAQAYADRWNNVVRPDIENKMGSLLDDIAKSLNDTARILEETDAQISAAFK